MLGYFSCVVQREKREKIRTRIFFFNIDFNKKTVKAISGNFRDLSKKISVIDNYSLRFHNGSRLFFIFILYCQNIFDLDGNFKEH